MRYINLRFTYFYLLTYWTSSKISKPVISSWELYVLLL